MPVPERDAGELQAPEVAGGVRTRNVIRIASTLVCLATLNACGPSVDAGKTALASADSAGRAVDDAMLTTRVKAALVENKSVEGGAISVSSERGRVRLAGAVPADQIPRAEAIVRRVEGVVEVVNVLTPRAPS